MSFNHQRPTNQLLYDLTWCRVQGIASLFTDKGAIRNQSHVCLRLSQQQYCTLCASERGQFHIRGGRRSSQSCGEGAGYSESCIDVHTSKINQCHALPYGEATSVHVYVVFDFSSFADKTGSVICRLNTTDVTLMAVPLRQNWLYISLIAADRGNLRGVPESKASNPLATPYLIQ